VYGLGAIAALTDGSPRTSCCLKIRKKERGKKGRRRQAAVLLRTGVLSVEVESPVAAVA
jgi:hypothetical protein